jgi:hypothetical protein
MNCEAATELLSQRFIGSLKPDDERGLEIHLAQCPACRDEANAGASLWADLGKLDDEIPQQRMRARFHAALAAYEQRPQATGLERFFERIWPQRPVLQGALAAALLVLGVAIGQWSPSSTEREIASLREEVRTVGLVLLGHQSASERLRGVDWARRTNSDAGAVAALLETVRYDPNLNVRLAAVDALSDWLDRPQVGAGLTNAFETQESPLMQVTLAGVLLEGHVDGSTDAARRMLVRDDLDPSVRDFLRMALGETGSDSAEI